MGGIQRDWGERKGLLEESDHSESNDIRRHARPFLPGTPGAQSGELEILTLLKWLASSTLLASEPLSAWSRITGTKKQNYLNLATHISGLSQEHEAVAGRVGGLKFCFLYIF